MDMRMPAIFLGHGNPMNALLDNAFTRGWESVGRNLPRPRAVVCVSAHWYFPQTMVTAMPVPRIIHDFGGFPRRLYEMDYPAPGAPELAARIRDLLAPTDVELDQQWGLDHGAWSVLCRIFPQADVPVVQLSIDERKPAGFHFQLAGKLAALREEGMLIVGSGNIVHNLLAYAGDEGDVSPYDWAVQFDGKVRDLIMEGRDEQLIDYEGLGESARSSVPTPDHYLPLLYILALRRKDEPVSFPVEGFDGGSISMRAVRIG